MTVDIRQPIALRTLHGIELAAVGTWNASTGTTTFTDEDFTNAIAALQCPGVRNPVIKLGHAEPDSTGGVRWDGEPAVGWVANMRFDGAKMLGDLTGVPAWLADADENGLSVLAAAYPDRSIEIWRPFVCQIGHEHPSVITALSLLGVAPPGVGVLKSMQDVYAAFTEPTPGDSAATMARAMLSTTVTLAAAAEPRGLTDIEQQSGVDFAALRTVWDSELDDLVTEWDDLSATQRADLAAQIQTAVDEDNPDALGALLLTGTAGSALLVAAMLVMAQTAADDMVAAAAKQGTILDAVVLTEADLADVATAVAAAMADGTAATAGRMAAQLLGTGDGQHVAFQVVGGIEGLTDRFLRDQLGGALSAAQHVGRHKALAQFSGDVEWHASEVNDTNACAPCREIDGHRFGSEDEALTAYGSGKFSGCLAGARCRGQLIPILGSDRSAASAPISTTVRMTLGGPMGTKTGGVVKASVSVEDISRKYYETAGYSMWITEMQVDPLQLIAADDGTGKYYRIPVELSGDQFTFGDPQEVAVAYQDVKAVAKAAATWADRKAAFAAARKNEDGTDLVAQDVSPAGAAIRKALEVKASTATVETEVPVAKTPDADSAAGPTTTPKEASVDAAKMREALGLAPEATDAEVSEAFAAQASAPVTPPTTPDPAATLTAIPPSAGGAMLIDPENYKALVAMAAKGQTAFEQMQRNERDHVLGKAVTDGRFPVSRLSTYSAMWDKDPASTKAYIELMPKNSVPVMAAGFLGAEISQNDTDIAYEGVYGKAGA
jgi:hypothetical protein